MTQAHPACSFTTQIDAHFAGKSSVAGEAELRRHMLAGDGCPTCHHRYTRQSMLARMTPGAPTAQQRLARALGIGARGRPSWAGLLALLAAFGAVAAFLLIPRDPRDGFQARGAPALKSSQAEVRVFRVRPGAASLPWAERLAASDELAFAYRNQTGKRHLFIFGVDEHGHVYWFSPPWRSDREQPAPLVALGDGQLHEIEDAVGHAYDGTQLTLHALFTDRAWTLPDLEAEVARAPGRRPAFAGDVTLVQSVEITR
jgi:hypothetical protein